MAKTKKRKRALLTSVVRDGTITLPREAKKKAAPKKVGKKKRALRKKAVANRTVKKRAVKKLSGSRRAVDLVERRARRAREKNRLRAVALIEDIAQRKRRIEENPRIGNRRLMTMSVRDLLAATRSARRAAGAGRSVSEPEKEARKAARAVQKKLRAKGAKSAKARAKQVGGRWRIRIDVGVGEVGAVA